MTPECPCVREERPVPPCTRECFHFRLRGYCEHCRQGERPASPTWRDAPPVPGRYVRDDEGDADLAYVSDPTAHPPAPPVRWYGPLPVDG